MLCLDAKTDWQTLKSEQTPVYSIYYILVLFKCDHKSMDGEGRIFTALSSKLVGWDIEQFGLCNFNKKKFYLAIYILVNMWSRRT